MPRHQRSASHARPGAIATGIPSLRRFAVQRPGPVLLYPAEDALHIVRRRLQGICAAAIRLAGLNLRVITAPSLRLDLADDRRSLDETLASLQPRLLVLDRFVRPEGGRIACASARLRSKPLYPGPGADAAAFFERAFSTFLLLDGSIKPWAYPLPGTIFWRTHRVARGVHGAAFTDR
jgi:hypothetical protein